MNELRERGAGTASGRGRSDRGATEQTSVGSGTRHVRGGAAAGGEPAVGSGERHRKPVLHGQRTWTHERAADGLLPWQSAQYLNDDPLLNELDKKLLY